MRLFNENLMDLFEIKSSRAFIYIDVKLKTKVAYIPPPVAGIRVDGVNVSMTADICIRYRSDMLVYTVYQGSTAIHHFDPDDGNGGV
jgi:hypothetical protein